MRAQRGPHPSPHQHPTTLDCSDCSSRRTQVRSAEAISCLACSISAHSLWMGLWLAFYKLVIWSVRSRSAARARRWTRCAAARACARRPPPRSTTPPRARTRCSPSCSAGRRRRPPRRPRPRRRPRPPPRPPPQPRRRPLAQARAAPPALPAALPVAQLDLYLRATALRCHLLSSSAGPLWLHAAVALAISAGAEAPLGAEAPHARHGEGPMTLHLVVALAGSERAWWGRSRARCC